MVRIKPLANRRTGGGGHIMDNMINSSSSHSASAFSSMRDMSGPQMHSLKVSQTTRSFEVFYDNQRQRPLSPYVNPTENSPHRRNYIYGQKTQIPNRLEYTPTTPQNGRSRDDHRNYGGDRRDRMDSSDFDTDREFVPGQMYYNARNRRYDDEDDYRPQADDRRSPGLNSQNGGHRLSIEEITDDDEPDNSDKENGHEPYDSDASGPSATPQRSGYRPNAFKSRMQPIFRPKQPTNYFGQSQRDRLHDNGRRERGDREYSPPRRQHIPTPPEKTMNRVYYKTPKKTRYRPGAKALKEIRKYQKSTSNLIQMLPFQRVVRQVADRVAMERGIEVPRFTREAIACAQEAAESFLVRMFSDAYKCSVHAKRVTLQVSDIQLVRQLQGW